MAGAQVVKLTDEEWALLSSIEYEAWRGRGRRVEKSKERDRLKRLGLIASRPPNAGIGRGIGGHAHVWNPTAAGIAALESRTAAA